MCPLVVVDAILCKAIVSAPVNVGAIWGFSVKDVKNAFHCQAANMGHVTSLSNASVPLDTMGYFVPHVISDLVDEFGRSRHQRMFSSQNDLENRLLDSKLSLKQSSRLKAN